MSSLVLHLWPEERKVFDGYSSALKNGWQVEAENLTYDERPEQRRMRLMLLRIRDPKLQSFLQDAAKHDSVDEMVKYIHDADLSEVNDSDLAELFFAMGPTVLSALILVMMNEAKTDDDVEGIAAMTEVRHSLLTSAQPV